MFRFPGGLRHPAYVVFGQGTVSAKAIDAELSYPLRRLHPSVQRE
jgi:hypothetical protein